MMRGIDISNWQGGMDLLSVLPNTDFVICKATGGCGFIDSYCDGWIQQCINNNKPWGFYHFGNDINYNDASDEAYFFIQNCWNYFGHGIPILDWEVDSIDTEWVNRFVNIVHSETGIWCWIYGNAWRFNEDVEQNCGRWVASYPSSLVYPSIYCDLPEPPTVNGLMCAWQFASDCQVEGYNGNLDGNIFYGDEEAWAKYAGYWTDYIKPQPEPEPIIEPKIIIVENDKYKITIEEK